MLGKWMRELREDGDEILKETGARSEWMEDSNGEFTLPGRSEGSGLACLSGC